MRACDACDRMSYLIILSENIANRHHRVFNVFIDEELKIKHIKKEPLTGARYVRACDEVQIACDGLHACGWVPYMFVHVTNCGLHAMVCEHAAGCQACMCI